MLIYKWLVSIVMILFLQHDHVAVSSSYNETTTYLCPKMQQFALFQFSLSLAISTSPSTCDNPLVVGHSYPKTIKWIMSSDCCTWDGVTCNQMTGDVIRLDLRCSQLVGAISPNSTLFQLSHLQSLDLSYNDLHGVLPEDIFHLPNLEELSLVSNFNLTVSLPKAKWGSSSTLQILSIKETTVSGTLPDSIGYLKSLTFLILSECNIIAPIPKSMGNLTQLKILDLHSNKISGQVSNSISSLQNLTLLDLGHNNLIGQFPPCIASLGQLFFLDLSHNSLTGPLPSNLTTLYHPELTSLLLNKTTSSGMFGLPSLEYLNIGSNGFTGQLYKFDAFKSSLRFLSCSNNFLTGKIPKSFFELVNLTSLDLSSNNFTGHLDVQMRSPLESFNTLSIKTTKNLKYLDLSHNQIDGEIPQWIGLIGRHWLFYLNLSYNHLSDGLENLPWNTLNYLDLQFNMLNGSLPGSICNSSSLDILNLSQNNLSGVLPSCPEKKSYMLSVLDLRKNSIKGSLPSTLSNFYSLRSLNLHGNKLEGKIPISFAEFNHLEVLDLGSNLIRDTFPWWLEALQNLQILVLKSNKFHGIINNISKIDHPFPSLRIIDLSDNEFSGPMPSKYIENFKAMMNGDVNKMERSYMGSSRYSDTMIMVIKGVEIVRENPNCIHNH